MNQIHVASADRFFETHYKFAVGEISNHEVAEGTTEFIAYLLREIASLCARENQKAVFVHLFLGFLCILICEFSQTAKVFNDILEILSAIDAEIVPYSILHHNPLNARMPQYGDVLIAHEPLQIHLFVDSTFIHKFAYHPYRQRIFRSLAYGKQHVVHVAFKPT